MALDVSDTRRMDQIPREFVALRGGVLKRVYSLELDDGTVALGDHEAWLARRAARCSCGAVCLGSGRTCGRKECIARLSSI
jgi:hypothetical protein